MQDAISRSPQCYLSVLLLSSGPIHTPLTQHVQPGSSDVSHLSRPELFCDLFCGPQSVIPCSTPRLIQQMDNPLALALKSPTLDFPLALALKSLTLDFPHRQTPTLNLNLMMICRFRFELDIFSVKYLTSICGAHLKSFLDLLSSLDFPVPLICGA
jgi:hypothetical protein